MDEIKEEMPILRNDTVIHQESSYEKEMKNIATHSRVSEKALISCFSSCLWPDTWNCQTVCPNFSFQKYSRLTQNLRSSGATGIPWGTL